MLHSILRNKLTLTLLSATATLLSTGCGMVYDDMPDCPAQLRVKFQFNYTLDRGEAFAEQVHSVNVWAFDQSGRPVWSGAAQGESLKSPDFLIETPLGAGTYDFVAWCGLRDNADFNLDTYTPSSREELEVKLATIETDGLNVSSSRFSDLFHGMAEDFTYTINPEGPSIATVTIPLIKDTNTIAVMLVNEDGTTLDERDFTVTFTYADSWLAWNNDVMATSPLVTYRPWAITGGETPLNRAGDGTLIRSSLLYELSVSRLIVDGDAWLNVVRNTDGERIIHIRLIDYFIYEKGERWNFYGDQEYLDRRSDYSALFFIDNDLGWYTAMGIYINGWAVVPEQNK